MSPTARSLKLLRDEGYLAGVVERRNPKIKFVTHDLFGFVDIAAAGPDGRTLWVQATSINTGGNLTARIAKAQGLATFHRLVALGHIVEFHGWAKRGPRGARKTWQVTRRAFSRFTLPACDSGGDAA